MSLKEQVVQELNTLSEAELKQVAEYLSSLKSRAHADSARPQGEGDWAALYAEFAEEDRQMAEEGIADYAQSLAEEDEQ